VPVQARSTQLVADILKAAARVLEREGARRFTTVRVAAAAGVSVGSLYQYFPNKQAILYRLQVDEWQKTGAALHTLLTEPSRPPAERLRAMIGAFFHSECEEAPLRRALDAAAPDHHTAPEVRANLRRARRVLRSFVADVAPRATPDQRRFAAELLLVSVSSIGKQVSEANPSAAEVERWADAVTDMLLAHLERLGRSARSTR
jgi:AcrR family transcriptional regulator